ncbi:hypothetical protein D3C76_365510 [compost metagenome]
MSDARGGKVLEQRQRVVPHVLVHFPGCPIGDAHQVLGNPGEELLAVAPSYETPEERLIARITQTLAQYFAGEAFQVGAYGPGSFGVIGNVDNDLAAGVEQPTFVQYFEYHDLLQITAERLELPGHHFRFVERAGPSVLAQVQHQFQFSGSQYSFAFGLAGIDQHDRAVQLGKRRSHAAPATGLVARRFEHGVQVLLIAPAQIQLAAQACEGWRGW